MFLPGDIVRDSRRKYTVVSVDDSNPRDIQYAVENIPARYDGDHAVLKWISADKLEFVKAPGLAESA